MGTPKSGHTFKNTSVAPRSLAFWFGPASFSGAQLFEELLCTFHCYPLIQMVGGEKKEKFNDGTIGRALINFYLLSIHSVILASHNSPFHQQHTGPKMT